MPKAKTFAPPQRKPVRFSVRLPQADEVSLTGDFTNWTPEGIPLHHDGAAIWYATLDLPPGTYQYRLRVDGEWRDNPDAARKIPNPFGTENCILSVE
jgi:1,4-alpha-glucan branching enzyme